MRLHSALVTPADRLRHAHVAYVAIHPAGIAVSLGARHTRRQVLHAHVARTALHSAGIAASLGTCHARRQASACECRACRPAPCLNRAFTRHLSCSPTGSGMRMSRVPTCSMLEPRLHSALAMPADRLRHAHVAYVALLHASIAASRGARHTRRPALTRAALRAPQNQKPGHKTGQVIHQ